MNGGWHTRFFDCFDDHGICCATIWCPCWVMGKTQQQLGGSCCIMGTCFFIPIIGGICIGEQRTKLRKQRTIPGTAFTDCILGWFCPQCVLCQNAREMSIPEISTVSSNVVCEQPPGSYPPPPLSAYPYPNNYDSTNPNTGYLQPLPQQFETLPEAKSLAIKSPTSDA